MRYILCLRFLLCAHFAFIMDIGVAAAESHSTQAWRVRAVKRLEQKQRNERKHRASEKRGMYSHQSDEAMPMSIYEFKKAKTRELSKLIQNLKSVLDSEDIENIHYRFANEFSTIDALLRSLEASPGVNFINEIKDLSAEVLRLQVRFNEREEYIESVKVLRQVFQDIAQEFEEVAAYGNQQDMNDGYYSQYLIAQDLESGHDLDIAYQQEQLNRLSQDIQSMKHQALIDYEEEQNYYRFQILLDDHPVM